MKHVGLIESNRDANYKDKLNHTEDPLEACKETVVLLRRWKVQIVPREEPCGMLWC